MRHQLSILTVVTLLGVGTAAAQTTVTGQPSNSNNTSEQSGGQKAVTRPNTDTMDRNNPGSTGAVTNAKLESGANSFTEGEARRRLERAGFAEVKELKKDDQGIWRGQAMQNGRQVSVGLDFKGNVATQ